MVKVLLYPHFTGQYPILHSFWASFYFQMQQIQAGKKWDKNDKKRLEIAKSILFHIHKHCTTSFTVIWLPLKVANSKREKQLQNGTKWLDLTLQGI